MAPPQQNPASMTRSLAIILSVFAALAVLAGWFAFPSGQRDTRADLGKVLPGLSRAVNAVDTLTFSDVEGSVGLKRQEGQWQFADLPGIPVNQGKVREYLLDLADASLIEAKTDNSKFHDTIGLGADATQIALGPDMGVVLGKTAAGSGRFVRRLSDDQSYVAKGLRVPQVDIKTWADFDLPVAPRDLVTRVDVDDMTASYSVISEPEGQTLEDLQEGEALSYDGVLDTVVAGAVFLDYSAIKPLAEIDWTGAGTTVFHGPNDADRLTYKVAEDGEAIWLRADPRGIFSPDKAVDWAAWAFQISDYRKETLLKPRAALLMQEGASEGVANPQ